MRSRLGLVAVLAGACVAAASTVGAPVASAAAVPCSNIHGAGSSLQNVAQNSVWIPGFTGTPGGWEGFCETKAPEITYSPTSSGKGMEQWGYENEKLGTEKPFPAYVGTDVGPEGSETAGQIKNIDTAGKEGTKLNGVMAVPVAQSAVSVLVTLPASCFEATGAKKPRVTEKALAEEWFSHTEKGENLITNAKIKSGSCTVVPSLYARFSASGTTAGFKRWLSDLPSAHQAAWEKATSTAAKSENNEWAEGGAKPTEEVEGEKLEKGSQLAKAVFEKPGTSGAIGYADLADAVSAGFSTTVTEHTVGTTKYDSFVVEVQNNEYTSATPEYASPENVAESNCTGAEYKAAVPNEVAPNANWSNARQTNVISKTGSTTNYPICTMTFDLTWRNYEYLGTKYSTEIYSGDAQTANTVLGYLKWVVSTGQTTAKLKEDHFGPLPKGIDEKAVTGVTATNIKG
jgi:hypothetical protein